MLLIGRISAVFLLVAAPMFIGLAAEFIFERIRRKRASRSECGSTRDE